MAIRSFLKLTTLLIFTFFTFLSPVVAKHTSSDPSSTAKSIQATKIPLPYEDSAFPECVPICLAAASYSGDIDCPYQNFAIESNRACLCRDNSFMKRFTDCIMNGDSCGSVRDDRRAWTKPEEEYYAWIYMMYQCKEVDVNLNGVDFGKKFGIRRVIDRVAVTSTVDPKQPGAQYGIGKQKTEAGTGAMDEVLTKILVLPISVQAVTTIYANGIPGNNSQPTDSPHRCETGAPSIITITHSQTTTIRGDESPDGIPSERVVPITMTATVTPPCIAFNPVPITTLYTTLKSEDYFYITSTQAWIKHFTTQKNPAEGRLPDGGFGGELPEPTSKPKTLLPLETGGGNIIKDEGDLSELPVDWQKQLDTVMEDDPRFGKLADLNKSNAVGRARLAGGVVVGGLGVGMWLVFGNLI